MGLALPGQAREAIAAGHAALITTSTGQFLLPANLVADTWQSRFARDPTPVITATGAFGDFFTSARELSTVTEQTRAQLRGRGCTVHTADGVALEVPPRRLPTHPGPQNPPRPQAERHDPRGRRRCAAAHRVVLTQMVYTGTGTVR